MPYFFRIHGGIGTHAAICPFIQLVELFTLRVMASARIDRSKNRLSEMGFES
jgi:hypothetical protein